MREVLNLAVHLLVRPATLLKFHGALVEHKCRRLFSSAPSPRRNPRPKVPSADLIADIIALKRRNPHFDCIRIAQQVSRVFGIERGSIDGMSVCRIFNHAVPFSPHRNMSAPITTRCTASSFWNAVDLARNLDAFWDYYNGHRVLAGLTPAQRADALRPTAAELNHYGWQRHCRGLFKLPIAA